MRTRFLFVTQISLSIEEESRSSLDPSIAEVRQGGEGGGARGVHGIQA